MQILSTHQRKWKFPRPLKNNGNSNSKNNNNNNPIFTKYQHKKRSTYFLELSIIVAFIIVSLLANQDFTQKAECNTIAKTKIENINKNASNNDPKIKAGSSADCATSSSNERKPTRLDADENELVHIEEMSSQPRSKFSSDLSQQHTTHDQQIIPPHIGPVLNAETFQANDLVNLLDLQQEQQQHHNSQLQQQEQQNQFQNDDTFGDFLNANAKRLARSINSDGFEGDNFNNGMLEAESDMAEFIPNPEQQDNIESPFGDNASPLASSAFNDHNQREREAQPSSQADFVNRLAMEDQQKKQNEMQTAQAQHVARAIEDQQAALTRQHDILMKQQLDEALNDSDNDRAWRRSLTEKSNRRITSARDETSSALTNDGLKSNPSGTIYFGDHLENSSPGTNGFQLGESNSVRSYGSNPRGEHNEGDGDDDDEDSPTEASNNDESYDLAPAAQHHSYGAHYGALHKHQGKYYQSVESHKKGQYKSAFKRGNKKFIISGHAHQHGSHASGHVKWHSKKGKGSHHWDLKHKDKKHHHHHY